MKQRDKRVEREDEKALLRVLSVTIKKKKGFSSDCLKPQNA
jgi:hypothetical protein